MHKTEFQRQLDMNAKMWKSIRMMKKTPVGKMRDLYKSNHGITSVRVGATRRRSRRGKGDMGEKEPKSPHPEAEHQPMAEQPEGHASRRDRRAGRAHRAGGHRREKGGKGASPTPSRYSVTHHGLLGAGLPSANPSVSVDRGGATRSAWEQTGDPQISERNSDSAYTVSKTARSNHAVAPS